MDTIESRRELTQKALSGDRIACLDLASFLMAKGDYQTANYWKCKAAILKQKESELLMSGYTVEYLP